LPIALAGIVALGLVLGSLSFVLVRRRRQAIG
jgi:LPXTG-motif cell wall-anchored protein